MGFFILVAFAVCLLAWFHRGLALATKLFFIGTYAVSWGFILVDPYAGVGLQIWLIALVLGLFPAQMVWLDVLRWWGKATAGTEDNLRSPGGRDV